MRPNRHPSICTLALTALSGLGALPSAAQPREEVAAQATYVATLDATWSRGTHPDRFPPNPHFSGVIGGTHNSGIKFWEVGGLATKGIKEMAELGAKLALRSEVEAAIRSGHAASVISGGGISRSPNTASVTVTVTQEHPRVTLVSMLAPSPDWFVGVSGLNLLGDKGWVEQASAELWTHDAGTDSGATYLAANQATLPAQPISRSTAGAFVNGRSVAFLRFRRVDPPVNAPSLLLNNERFKVEAIWANGKGESDFGQPVPLTSDVGYFWFFNRENVELVLKILNGCDLNDHFWIFAAGLTNVEVQLTVTDQETGLKREFVNPLGRPFEPIQITDAFRTCPSPAP